MQPQGIINMPLAYPYSLVNSPNNWIWVGTANISATGKSYLKAYDIKGVERFSKEFSPGTASMSIPSISVTDSKVYISYNQQGSFHRIYTLDLEGNILSQFTPGSSVHRVDVDRNGDIYIARQSVGRTIEKKTASGSHLWTNSQWASLSNDPIFALGLNTIYGASLGNTTVRKLNPDTGAQVWSNTTGTSSQVRDIDVISVWEDGEVEEYVAVGTGPFGTDYRVVFFKGDDGTRLWSSPVQNNWTYSVTSSNLGSDTTIISAVRDVDNTRTVLRRHQLSNGAVIQGPTNINIGSSWNKIHGLRDGGVIIVSGDSINGSVLVKVNKDFSIDWRVDNVVPTQILCAAIQPGRWQTGIHLP